MASQRRDKVVLSLRFSHVLSFSLWTKTLGELFGQLRAELGEKERELSELQRRDASLLVPDAEQIDGLRAVIASLHLSTVDGSFVFFASAEEKRPIDTGMQAIKDLPRSMWIRSASAPMQQERRVIDIPRHPKRRSRSIFPPDSLDRFSFSRLFFAGGSAASVFETQPIFNREHWVKQH